MADFTGIAKEDHERLTEAARMYSNLTGKDLTGVVGRIPIENTQEDAKAKERQAEEGLQRKAAAQSQLESAQQEARRIQARTDDRGEVQPEDPPVATTERTRSHSFSRAGEEHKPARARR